MSEEITQDAPSVTEGEVQTEGETKTTGFYNGKYNSISDFEKSHDELQKSYSQKTAEYKEQMGAFSGAPETYEPAEGVEIDDSNPLFSKLQELGKDIKLDNDGFNKLVTMYNDTIAEQSAQHEENLKAEMAKLGDNANERIQNLTDWSNANVPEQFKDKFDSVATDALGVEFLEYVMSMSKPQGMAQHHQVSNAPTYSKEDVLAMTREKDEYGNRKMSSDPAFAKKVRELMAQYA